MQKRFRHFVEPPCAFLAPKVDEAIAFEGRGGMCRPVSGFARIVPLLELPSDAKG